MATQRIVIEDMPTPESIAGAYAATQAERQLIEEVTGVRIDDHGHVIQHLVVMPCTRLGCLFVAAASTKDGAVEKVDSHIRRRHASC